MTSRLKDLYPILMEQRKKRRPDRPDTYRAFFGQVKEIRRRINAGEGLSAQHDKDFLRRLLFEDNGITSRGQSFLRKKHLFINGQPFTGSVEKFLINDQDFINSLEQLITEPTEAHWRELRQVWRTTIKQNNHLLVNRVASACTLAVSQTVDVTKFDHVFDWLIRERIIPRPPFSAKRGSDFWFRKNVYLMKIIKETFSDDSDDLKCSKTYEFHLSMLVWDLYLYISNNH